MAHADFILSMTDVDLVAGMMRSLLALHQEDGEGVCLDCLSVYPCPSVRIIAASQDAAVARVASPGDTAWEKFMKRPVAPGEFSNEFYRHPRGPIAGGRGHAHKYPECPEFSGGICDVHHHLPIHPSAA